MSLKGIKRDAELIFNNLNGNFDVQNKKLVLISSWNLIGRLVTYFKNRDGSVDEAVTFKIKKILEKLYEENEKLIKEFEGKVRLSSAEFETSGEEDSGMSEEDRVSEGDSSGTETSDLSDSEVEKIAESRGIDSQRIIKIPVDLNISIFIRVLGLLVGLSFGKLNKTANSLVYYANYEKNSYVAKLVNSDMTKDVRENLKQQAIEHGEFW